MGGSTYSHDDFVSRSVNYASASACTGIPLKDVKFAFSADIHTGKTDAKVHDKLAPKGKDRESRDSDAHPITIPIGILLDTTGSMAQVPVIIQEALPKLMGGFLDDKTSGKKYLGEAYPAICIGAVDDYYAQSHYHGAGSFQIGQFESGIEIDDDLTRLWLTGNGGGSYEESYDLGLYYYARHIHTDHWDKRKRKGYLFIIGDEHGYPNVDHKAVKQIIGDTIQADIPFADIVKEAQQHWHVFMVIPNMTQHYGDKELAKYWTGLLGQQNVLKLEDPEKIYQLIVSAVAICEQHVNMDDLEDDGIMDAPMTGAIVKLANFGVSKAKVDNLPEVSGASGATRL
jgi:hypothetical protein